MNTATVKSIRLSANELRDLSQLSKQVASTETNLLKKWVREGMRSEKLDLAIRAYMQRKTDLRGGAAMAGLSYNRFLREIQSRHIVILEDEGLLQRLDALADAFEDETLRAALRLTATAE